MPATAFNPASSLSGIRAVSLVQPREPAPTIASLTRRLAAGDEAAFREFHALYFDRLYYFLLVVTRGQAHAAQDAVQETMLRVTRHAREFDDEEIFWSWLKAVARNAARDGGRKQRRYLAVLERFSFGRAMPPPDPVGDDRLRSLLDEALAQIDPADRILVERKYLRGDSLAELAAAAGLTEKAVESRLFRLRRQLADLLLQQLRQP